MRRASAPSAALAGLLIALRLFLAAPVLAAPPQAAPATLVIGTASEPQTLDPQAAAAIGDLRIDANIFEGLVRHRPGSLDIEPALALSWTISPDRLVYRFDLRPNVTFHDGTALDAAAVAFTFQRMLDADHPFHGTGPFPFAYLFAGVRSVTALDAHSVEFRLAEPFAPFLSNLAEPAGFVVSPAAVRRYGPDFGRHPVGTGPFRLKAWLPETEIALERSPTYWEAPPPGAGGVGVLRLRPISGEAARLAALRAGTADVVFDLAPERLAALRREGRFVVADAVGPHLWFLILNTREGPFSDKRVRQAANEAVDKRRIVDEVLGGGAEIAAGPIPAAFGWASDPAVTPYPFDPERARALLRQAGAEGAKITILAPTDGPGMLDSAAIAAAVRRDLAAVGFTVDLETLPWTDFLSRVNPGLAGRADMAAMAWTTTDPDTLPFLALRGAATPNAGGFNTGLFEDPALDTRIEAARRAGDRSERARLYREIQRLAHDDAPFVFIASEKKNVAARRGIQGLAVEPSFLVDFRRVTKN